MSIFRNLKYLINSNGVIGRTVVLKHITGCSFCTESKSVQKDDKRYLFFDEEVQALLKKLTRLDVEKVFRIKKIGKQFDTPEWKFMSNEELDMAKEETLLKAEVKLQMPPVLPPVENTVKVIVKDDKLIGHCDSTFVFTDISYGKNDRNRHIIVRDPDGTLRNANWEERSRCNEIYFPRPGRKLRVPRMFLDPYLEEVLSRGAFEFLLDRACVQFEPDDPLFVQVTEATYDKVTDTSSFPQLMSTRHWGPLLFYLARQDRLSPLLQFYLQSDRLEDIMLTISLYNKLHPEKQCSRSYVPGQEMDFLKVFIGECYPKDAQLELAFKSYLDYVTKPKSEAVQ